MEPSRGVSLALLMIGLLLVALDNIGRSRAQVLNPPYFNLAEGRKIWATATCGEGLSEPELYCKLVGANLDKQDNPNINLIQGQVCDYCDPNDVRLAHPAEYAIDGTERWWQSPPLSRGNKYNEVNLTIDLGQEFHVAYVFIKMANSPRPGVWILERSTDNGQTYVPWQYFADTPSDCVRYFGPDSLLPIKRDDSVVCETKFSKVVPLEGGEMVVSLLNGRPSAENFSQSADLQEWTKATNVRLRLLRTKTLLGHLMSLARQDPTVTRRYFYSIKDVNIGGRCVCNGHADTCDITDSNDPSKLLCRCQHNTCGAQCEKCCPGFVQKKWQRATVENPNACEACNCYGHSDDCEYDEEIDRLGQSIDIHGQFKGGGRCLNCQHNTEGINCNRCKPGYYRPYGKELNATDVCQPCYCDPKFSTGNCFDGDGRCECRPEFQAPDCDTCSDGYYDYPECKPCDCNVNGTHGSVCQVGGGQCPCKPNYVGQSCDRCAEGYYGFPLCLPCDCNPVGSPKRECNMETGQCMCDNSFGGRQCDQCAPGFYGYPNCKYCDCDPTGTTEEICNRDSGFCTCKQGYGGPRCDRCISGFFGYPNCVECKCNPDASQGPDCDLTGRCRCLPNFAGLKCDSCHPGHYSYPDCLPCNCDHAGSKGISCNSDGTCTCHANFDGEKCDQCKEGFYNYPICEECNCNPAGVLATFAGCGSLTSGELCECKERVTGRICDKCQPLYWNLQTNNPLGCEDCQCNIDGTIGGISICDSASGQCLCKPNVRSRQCNECVDGSFQLRGDNLFGCQDCACDVGGAVSNVCDRSSGQCTCRPRIAGRKCNRPIQTHYFPSLFQHQFELEDGRTPSGTPVRFGFDKGLFPNFSWRGYAIFQELQKAVVLSIYVDKPSLYRAMMYYLNYGGENIYGTITFIPETSGDIQISDMVFPPSSQPRMMVVSGKQGLVIPPFVLNPGHWQVYIKVEKALFVDYLVLLPQAYYEATLLQEENNTPCQCGRMESLCRHFQYPSLPTDGGMVSGEGGYIDSNGSRKRTQLYTNDTVLEELGAKNMALLNEEQNTLMMDLRVAKSGRYVLVVMYHMPESQESTEIVVETATENQMSKGQAILYACDYTFVCRQVVTTSKGEVASFDFDTSFVQVTLATNDDVRVNIDGITAIPYEMWNMDYIVPQPVCMRKNGVCVDASFPIAPGATKIECESGENAEQIASELPSTIRDDQAKLIFLDHKNSIVDIQGAVPEEGWYTFVVHYYQPDHPSFTMNVLIQNGQFYDASVALNHCPNSEGCRAVIRSLENNSTNFKVLENVLLTFKEPNHKSVWLDYILAVPADQYDPAILHLQKKDLAGEFITLCGQNNFFLSPDEEGFCREAAFSLSAEYNNGAVPCHCNIDGSKSFECEAFGGQCYCKPNIIGRTCSQCSTGYFGFPDCKPCDCPSTALCHPKTGQCVCPPRVTGDRCDACIQFSFGFDPIIGCEECNCNRFGVSQGNLQCDLHTGQCLCKPNVQGRTCERCKSGYWSFPTCQLCNCDLRGTTDEICNQDTARCFCKENVYGEFCDQCKPGTFFLEESNPFGCTKCFCFGTTDRCTSSSLKRIQILEMKDWRAVGLGLDTQVNELPVNATIDDSSGEVEAMLTSPLPTGTLFYFAAPPLYLGNKVTSYGGVLDFTIHVTTLDVDESAGGIVGPDLILTGNNITLIHDHWEQPAAGLPLRVEVHLAESEFRHPSGGAVTREQMMMVLVNLDGLYIRGSYFQPSDMFRLSRVLLDTATEGFLADAENALRVEQCYCPPNYQGTSCEECAPGYYRAKTGPYLGFCVPCQCNGHSDRCDVNTGKCMDCLHNTVGDHCETCVAGYYGDATHGSPYDCLICACPHPTQSNNFAESCEVSESGKEIRCTCKPGYYGAKCDVCAAGYFGRPDILGQSCQPCQCSGNINPDHPGSCDSVTGECVLCLNNTYGPACELCAPGFYGDAISKKDCRACNCNDCGTLECSNQDGQCHCHLGVVGDMCDMCAVDHWGFDSCSGCRPCNCDIASHNSTCNLETGQCSCKPGVTGLTCDVCERGYWRYSPSGCLSCNCFEKYSTGVGCDPLTGQCQCLPGVVGEKCDSCPHRWAFVHNQGCIECEPCVHFLLDDTDDLYNLLEPTYKEMMASSASVFAQTRLYNVNRTIEELTPLVENLIHAPGDIDVSDLQYSIRDIERESEDIHAKANTMLGEGLRTSKEADSVQKEALEIATRMKSANANTHAIVQELKQLADSLEKDRGQNVDYRIAEAERILGELKARNLSFGKEDADIELANAKELLERVLNFHHPSKNQEKKVLSAEDNLNKLEDLLEELKNYSQIAKDIAAEANWINRNNDEALGQGIQSMIKDLEAETVKTLLKARELSDYAVSAVHDDANGNQALENFPDELSQQIAKLRDFLNNNEIDVTKPYVENVTKHADNLMKQAAELENSFASSRAISDAAVQAAQAYGNIVSAIEDAMAAAEGAVAAADQAGNMSDGVAGRAADSKERSFQLLGEAETLQQRVKKDLGPKSKDSLERLRALDLTNTKLAAELDGINKDLDRLPLRNLGALAYVASNDSGRILAEAEAASSRVQDILTKLPEDREKAAKLPQDVIDTQQAVKEAHNYVDRVSTLVPDIHNLIDRTAVKYERYKVLGKNLDDKIEELKRKIALARDQANRIKVGVTFRPNATLQLRNPDTLSRAATYTHMSMYFQTEMNEGLLAYVGNEIGTHKRMKRATTDDYMALEVRGGQIVLVMNLGSGSEEIMNTEYVADGRWHQVIVERTGKAVTIVVRTEDEPDVVQEGHLPGTHIVFNLDQNLSKFYVGGIPDLAEVQPDVRNRRFVGKIEDLTFGKSPVGLWNFVKQENILGAMERDKLVHFEQSNGMRFDGSGYAILSRGRESFVRTTYLTVFFKTYAKEGLIFLIGKESTFLALEIRDGHIIMKYNLGDETAELRSPRMYNDGKWHKLEANREENVAVLNLDDETVGSTETSGGSKNLQTTDEIYVGGYPGNHLFSEVTSVGFEGCLRDMQIDSQLKDLNVNKEALGAVPGCPATIARTVSFSSEALGYVALKTVDLKGYTELTFKFKTTEEDGLIFYAANEDQSHYLTIFLSGGSLVMRCQPGGEIRTNANMVFNDKEWHYIIATKVRRRLRFDIDDIDFVEAEVQQDTAVEITTPLYFGGVPETYPLSPDAGSRTKNFIGCLGDTNVNGKFQNFADTTDKPGASLASCPLVSEKEKEAQLTSVLPVDKVTEPSRPTVVSTVATAMTPKPTPLGQCMLPLDPSLHPPEMFEDGQHFGVTPWSRIEYALRGDIIGGLLEESQFSLEFRTSQRNGVLFYIAGNNNIDFVSLVMFEGKIVYLYNCGSGSTALETVSTFNDGEWYTATFTRKGQSGRLVVHNEDVYGVSPGNSSSMNVRSPLYIGGLSETAAKDAKHNLMDVTNSFPGCIRKIKVQGIELEPDSGNMIQTIDCTDTVEDGTFFSSRGDGGHIILNDKFKVGRDIDIKMEIKPRSLSGVLMAVHGNKDYLVLQMIDGSIKFSVDNGIGEFSTTYVPDEKHALCDGNWHRIQAVKSKNIVTLSIDDKSAPTGIGAGGVSATDTSDPLYIGGLPNHDVKGVETKEQFVGCMRNLNVNSNLQNFYQARIYGSVFLSICPTY